MTLPQTPSFRLDGKRALVTGASSGIGLASAVALAEAGADVVITARSVDKLRDLEAAIMAAGWQARAIGLDITDVDATRQLIKDEGPFDILLNSAGMARHGPALETEVEDYEAVQDINQKASYFLNQAIARQLIDAGKGGSLITISSQMAHVGGIDRAVYCLSLIHI